MCNVVQLFGLAPTWHHEFQLSEKDAQNFTLMEYLIPPPGRKDIWKVTSLLAVGDNVLNATKQLVKRPSDLLEEAHRKAISEVGRPWHLIPQEQKLFILTFPLRYLTWDQMNDLWKLEGWEKETVFSLKAMYYSAQTNMPVEWARTQEMLRERDIFLLGCIHTCPHKTRANTIVWAQVVALWIAKGWPPRTAQQLSRRRHFLLQSGAKVPPKQGEASRTGYEEEDQQDDEGEILDSMDLDEDEDDLEEN